MGFGDIDYMPASPAQPPFLDLLEASRETGLGLIRRLVDHAISFYADDNGPGHNGYTLEFEGGPRFFPWRDSYFWSRDQASEHSVASALMALEAWGHERLEAGDPVDEVIADILGPDGSCAAYVLVAVDLLISHWPATRDALAPFVSCPSLLATERGRVTRDQIGLGFGGFQAEPSGRVRLQHLRQRPSRGVPLERVVPYYSDDDPISQSVRTRLQAAVDELGGYQEYEAFGDPAFMGAYALNLVTPANWEQVEGGRAYRSPPTEAEHLERLQSRNADHLRSSEIEAKIQLAIGDPARASAQIAREAVDYAQGDLPDDTDTDVLRSRSTRLITTALLVARDGDDALLAAQEPWVREVLTRGLAEQPDMASGSRDSLQFNRPALATCALIHLWRRRRQVADRDALVAIALRDDGAGPVAFAAALGAAVEADPRLAKSVLRAAFSTCRWRWSPWNEDEVRAKDYAREKAALGQRTAVAEIAWLNGAAQPDWPSLPESELSIRKGSYIRVPRPEAEPSDDEDLDDGGTRGTPLARVHVNTQALAAWLKVMSEAKTAAIAEWLPDIVIAYADWSARANGLGQAADTELDRTPSEWNDQFYALLTPVMLDSAPPVFEGLLGVIEQLPDQTFADIAEIVLHAADVWYFNTPDRAADRVIALRQRLATRTMQMRRWRRNLRPGDLSVDQDIGPLVGKLLMNTHNPFARTESYLVPNVFDRIDPLLEPMSALMAGGPLTFIALCTMNTLMVAPRERHAQFMVSAVETWFERLPSDKAMWVELGIGHRVVEWLEAATSDNARLLGRAHPLRARIDAILGRLVALGVPESHEMELRIEREASSTAGPT